MGRFINKALWHIKMAHGDPTQFDLPPAELAILEQGLGQLPPGIFKDFVLGDYGEEETFEKTMEVNWPNVPITMELKFANSALDTLFGSQPKTGE